MARYASYVWIAAYHGPAMGVSSTAHHTMYLAPSIALIRETYSHTHALLPPFPCLHVLPGSRIFLSQCTMYHTHTFP